MPPPRPRDGDAEDSVSVALVDLIRRQADALQAMAIEGASTRAAIEALSQQVRAWPQGDTARIADQIATLSEKIATMERAFSKAIAPVAILGILVAMGFSAGPRLVAFLLGGGP